MKKFDPQYFRNFPFTQEQIEKYWKNALKDLSIAKKDSIPDVKFSYGYSALLKMGITLLAKMRGVKVRSVPGHHIKILEALSTLLEDPKIAAVGNAMRNKRNTDLYGEGAFISEKEARDCLNFVVEIVEIIKKKHGLGAV